MSSKFSLFFLALSIATLTSCESDLYLALGREAPDSLPAGNIIPDVPLHPFLPPAKLPQEPAQIILPDMAVVPLQPADIQHFQLPIGPQKTSAQIQKDISASQVNNYNNNNNDVGVDGSENVADFGYQPPNMDVAEEVYLKHKGQGNIEPSEKSNLAEHGSLKKGEIDVKDKELSSADDEDESSYLSTENAAVTASVDFMRIVYAIAAASIGNAWVSVL